MKRLTVMLGFIVLLTMTSASSSEDMRFKHSRYKYIALFNADMPEQRMVESFSFDKMRTEIRRAWKEGLDIVSLKYGNGHWIGVFQKANFASHQTYIVAPRWNAVDAHLSQYWKNGYYITHIEHGLGEWVVVFEKNTGFTNQAYERRKKRDAFISAVKKRWKEGYDLIDIEYGEGRFTGIFAEGTELKNQALIERSFWYDVQKAIVEYWQKGYRVTDIEYTLGRWMVLFSKYSRRIHQRYESASTVEGLRKRFDTLRAEGFGIVDLAEGW
jgi:hypothetical protein